MILTTESALVQAVTTATPNVDVNANWADVTATTFIAGNTNTKISSAATTTIVGSPAASTQRQVKSITIRNIHATDPNTVSILHTDGTTSTMVYKITLAAGESAEYDGQVWQSYNSSGMPTNATTTGGLTVADLGGGAETVGGAASNGTAATASRSDHVHAITNPKLDDLATPDNNTDLNANTTNHGLLLIATAPAANELNVVGIANGETVYANKDLFNTTNPADSGVAAAGTSIQASRSDHVHAAPTTVSGNAGTVTVADAGGDTTTFPLLGTAATGSLAPATDAELTYNATTNTLATDNLVANTAVLPDANDGAALGTTALQFSDLFLAEGGVINFDNGDVTITQVGNVLTITGGSTVLDSIELGHASNTTLARVSAGVVSIEGNNILVSGGALGTPSGGTVTNLTGTASININGTVGATTPSTVVATTITANTGVVPDANDGAYLGTTALQFSDLFLAEGGVINFDNGDVTITQAGNTLTITGGSTVVDSIELGHASDTTLARVSAGVVSIEGNNILVSGGALGTPSGGTVTNLTGTASININGTVGATTPAAGTFTTLAASTAANPLTLTNSSDTAAAQVAILQGDSATPADDDEAYVTLKLSDSAGNQDEQARITWAAKTVLNGATQDGALYLSVLQDGSLLAMVGLDGKTSIANIYSALVATGTVTSNTGFIPDANDGAYLGTSALGFSDLFLAEGGVINWDNGDLTLTQANNKLTIDGGDLTLAENVGIELDAALSADGKYSGIVEAGTAGAALAFGDLCYLAAADSRWELADADAEATAGPVKLGICVLAAAGDGSATTMLLYGKVRADAVFPTLTVSAPAYVGTTAGDIQVAAPSGAADIIRIVGHGNTGDELYFHPSSDWFEHA